MNNHLPRRTVLAFALAAGAFPPRNALAAYPDGPITWIVAYAAGGGTDTLARMLAEVMAPALGQPIVVENRPGGATNIAATAVAEAAPDGRTIFTADNGTLVFNTALFDTLPYDPETDFRKVGLIARFPLVLAVRKDSSATTVDELVRHAKDRPGAINYASPGIGSPHHLAMERLAHEAGFRLTHVPYKGAAPALNDLVGGHIETMVVDYPSGGGHIKAGTIRALAVCSATRLPGIPDVPTVAEAFGLAGFAAYAWQGLVVPARTPDPIVERLSAELAAALKQESVLNRMSEIGLEPIPGGPADMQRLTDREREIWVPLIKSLGITLS